jgi:hypothetical protein
MYFNVLFFKGYLTSFSTMPLDIQNYLVSEVCRCVKLKGKIREECEKK